MPTQLISIGTGAANSSDIVLADGETASVGIKASSSPIISTGCRVDIFIKDDGGTYWVLGGLSSSRPATIISGPGTYRLTRPATSAACGAYSG